MPYRKLVRRTLRVALLLMLFLFVLLNFILYNYTAKITFPVTANRLPKPTLTTWEKVQAVFFGLNIYKTKLGRYPDKQYTTVYFNTREGDRIAAWLLPADSAAGKTVILVPGFRNSKATLLPEADRFTAMGYNCLLLDLRANGGSEGARLGFGMDEAEEVYLAYHYIDSLYGKGPVVLWGESMGAVAILRAINLYPIQPDKLILEKPFDHFRQAVKNSINYFSNKRLPAGPLSVLATGWISWHIKHWAFDHCASNYAKAVKCPVLLQYGSLDKVTDLQQVRHIYDVLPVKDKHLEIYPDGGHRLALCTSEPSHWEAAIADFLHP